MREILVIGGGVSGMSAAITAARKGAKVTILEHNDILGKKILSTGNGRCNLANLDLNDTDYYSDHRELIEKVLEISGLKQEMDFLKSLGIDMKCRGNYVYPRSGQAASVREAFVLELRRLGVRSEKGCHVKKISKKRDRFEVFSNDGRVFFSDSVILSTGSKASSISGSDGSGYRIAKKLGHHIVEVVPALVQLRCEEDYFKKLAGVRMDAKVTLVIEGKEAASDIGELQFTNYGISGIPVFQISRHASKAIRKGETAEVYLDCIPGLHEKDFLNRLLERRSSYGKYMAQEMFCTVFPGKFTEVLLSLSEIGKTVWVEKIPERQWKSVAHLCKNFRIQIKEPNSFDQAQVCAGGINTSEICGETMESKLVRNLYITGELLDVDGICGGYNIYFAVVSGCLAGENAAKGESV